MQECILMLIKTLQKNKKLYLMKTNQLYSIDTDVKINSDI